MDRADHQYEKPSQGAHTPGPWRAWEPDHEGGKWQIDAPSGPMIPEKKIATVHRGALGGHDKSEANARLIAAAPDLLAACQDYMDGRGDWAAAMSRAIAKATGAA